jgi:hypothetical protein
MTKFGVIDDKGNWREIADIDQSVMLKCPHFIMDPVHYRDDGTCRCNDPDHKIMATWEYVWDDAQRLWMAAEDDDD